MTDANDRDALAASIAGKITDEPRHDRQEFVAVIFKNADGHLEATRLFTNGSYYSAPLGQALQAAGGTDNVVAVVHNHPSTLADLAPDRDDALRVNKMPSDGDWKTAADLFNSRTDVAYYLLGPDDVLRRYDYADRKHWDNANRPGRPERQHRHDRLGPEVDYKRPMPTPTAPPSDTAPANAHVDRLRAQVTRGVEKLDQGVGKDFDSNSLRLVESLTLLALREGLDRVDHVVLSVQGERVRAGENIFVVQGGLADATNRVAVMKTAEAMSVPMEVNRSALAAAIEQMPIAVASPVEEQSRRIAGPSI